MEILIGIIIVSVVVRIASVLVSLDFPEIVLTNSVTIGKALIELVFAILNIPMLLILKIMTIIFK